MFTGIIEATAKVLKKTENGLILERPLMFDDLKIGSSIAVSGVCLTITKFDTSSMSFDVVQTTLEKTKLVSLKAGDSVNLERAMKADGRFEGHIVQGHVEGTGKVVACSNAPTPNPSPVPVEGDAAESVVHVWKGVPGLRYPPTSVVANARVMRKEPTKAEALLWEELRHKKIDGYYFRRQRPIGTCIIDFYCEELRLAIEVDGSIHDEKEQRVYDQWRGEHLEWRGVRFLHFTNDEVINDRSAVIASIQAHCKAPLPSERGGVGGGGTVKQGNILLTVEILPSLLPFVVLHGSITIDGVALTIAKISGSQISVALIPHTIANTTLGALEAGDTVNLETDILGKYILKKYDQE